MENNNQDFNFTYSAKEQEEVKRIRKKYEPEPENKMEQLRRLDAGVTKKAVTFSITIGIAGALIMGSGMSLVMTDLADILGLTELVGMITGIATGIIGAVIVCFTYPAYKNIVRRERKKIAQQVIRLTDELMK
ncbi:MAG: GlsB/YeaQ/YmgE family stress response membrane protein [Lachnospira sp.]